MKSKFHDFLNYVCKKNISTLLVDKSGNFALVTALLMPVILVSAGGAIDFAGALQHKTHLQQQLDAGMLAAAATTDKATQRSQVLAFLEKSDTPERSSDLVMKNNADGSITGSLFAPYATAFLGIAGLSLIDFTITSTALGKTSTTSPCIYVLGNQNQAVLINSGANITSEGCTIQVHSTANPAFIMNSGSTIQTAKFCVKGTQNIRNGGTIANLVTGCAVEADPYAGKLSEPDVPSSCTTSGWMNGNNFTIRPGLHCETGFNGSPTIKFMPGLHIVKGRMIINSDATVIADGVTFYFPDVNSEIRINGGVTLTARAPESGPYKGILMFEKTSDKANNTNKQQYIFNGSKGEVLQGIIYLPNRDVTYNSTTNATDKISLVVNTMTMNASKWQMEPFGGAGGGAAGGIRLVR